MKSKRNWLVIGLLIIVFSLLLRVNSTTADLPPDISISGSIYTDEGNQCHNSRSKALFDNWYPDDWRITNYNPILPYLKLFIFKLFGVGLLQVRLVAHLFAFLSLLFFFLTLRSYFDQKFAALGILFLGSNYLFLMFNKIGTFETPMIFWAILCLYFLERYRTSQKQFMLFLAGVSAFTAFIFKQIIAYFVPVPVLAVLAVVLFAAPSAGYPVKKGLKAAGMAVLGISTAFLLWYLLFYLPNREWILTSPGQYIGNQVLPKNLTSAVKNFFGFNWKEQFPKIPIVWLGSIFYLPIFFRGIFKKRLNITQAGFVLFFLSHTIFFMFMNHRPTRYLIPVIPAMVFMTVLLFEKWYKKGKEKQISLNFFSHAAVYLLDLGWLTLAGFFCFFPLLKYYGIISSYPPLSFIYLAAAGLAIGTSYIIKFIYSKLTGFKPGQVPAVFLILVLSLASLIINLNHYVKWDREKTFTVVNMSKDLGQDLQDAYIAGLTAPVAVLENKHKSLFLYPNFVNYKNTFEKYNLTHALIASFNQEITQFFRHWPQRMGRAGLEKVYNVKEQFLHLYSFTRPYIRDRARADSGQASITVVNPGTKAVKSNIHCLDFIQMPGSDWSKTGRTKAERKLKEVMLEPGPNPIDILVPQSQGLSVRKTLVYLNFAEPKKPFRYEGEKFPRATGTEQLDQNCSAKFTRVFYQQDHNPGFLTYGPYVPYSEGVITVNFRIKFDKLKTRIRPLARLDINSRAMDSEDKSLLAFRTIKPRQAVLEKFHTYTLTAMVTGTQRLEFRVKAEKWSDIFLDYIEVEYVQGLFVQSGDSTK